MTGERRRRCPQPAKIVLGRKRAEEKEQKTKDDQVMGLSFLEGQTEFEDSRAWLSAFLHLPSPDIIGSRSDKSCMRGGQTLFLFASRR